MTSRRPRPPRCRRLRGELAKIDAITDAKGLAREVAHLQARGAGAFFGFGSQQDYKDATKVIGGVDQGGLGLPDRDYYLKDDAKMKELRALYERPRGGDAEAGGDPRRRCAEPGQGGDVDGDRVGQSIDWTRSTGAIPRRCTTSAIVPG